jgi:hypothetical protein
VGEERCDNRLIHLFNRRVLSLFAIAVFVQASVRQAFPAQGIEKAALVCQPLVWRERPG